MKAQLQIGNNIYDGNVFEGSRYSDYDKLCYPQWKFIYLKGGKNGRKFYHAEISFHGSLEHFKSIGGVILEEEQ